jgi:hypothetical protein
MLAGTVVQRLRARLCALKLSQMRHSLRPAPKRGTTTSWRKRQYCFTSLVGAGKANRLTGVRSECGQELNCLFLVIAVRAARWHLPPTSTSARDGGQRAHFVDANHNAVARRIAIESHDFVFFFDSNSGSRVDESQSQRGAQPG